MVDTPKYRDNDAIIKMPVDERNRAVRRAALFAKGRLRVINFEEFSAGDLVNEAIKRTLEGRRKWLVSVDLYDHLTSVINGIINNYKRSPAYTRRKPLGESGFEGLLNNLGLSYHENPNLDFNIKLTTLRQRVSKKGNPKLSAMLDALLENEGDIRDAAESIGLDKNNKKDMQEAYYLNRGINKIASEIEE